VSLERGKLIKGPVAPSLLDRALRIRKRGRSADRNRISRALDQRTTSSPEMHQAGEQWNQADDTLRQGALDPQYGTSSSSKTGQQTNRPQGSTEPSTGSDRDTMSGSRSKGR